VDETVAKTDGSPPYAVRVVAREAPRVTASAGIVLEVGNLPPPDSPVDTLIVAGIPLSGASK
jgi:hypothetical protein